MTEDAGEAAYDQISYIAEHCGVDGVLRLLREHCEERSRFWCRKFGRGENPSDHETAMSYMRWLAAIQHALKEGGG